MMAFIWDVNGLIWPNGGSMSTDESMNLILCQPDMWFLKLMTEKEI